MTSYIWVMCMKRATELRGWCEHVFTADAILVLWNAEECWLCYYVKVTFRDNFDLFWGRTVFCRLHPNHRGSQVLAHVILQCILPWLPWLPTPPTRLFIYYYLFTDAPARLTEPCLPSYTFSYSSSGGTAAIYRETLNITLLFKKFSASFP